MNEIVTSKEIETGKALHKDLFVQSLDICSTQYLRYIGVALGPDDLWIGLPRSAEGMTPELLSRALQRVGYASVRETEGSIDALPVPCMVFLKDGSYALVVKVSGDALSIIDTHNDCIVREVSKVRFAKVYEGEYYQFFPRIDALETKHTQVAHGRHWFWSRVLQPRSKFLAVVAASFVANIIAVSVSLFALQVYDRVIPNQNEATLWVLALGCGVAICFEFFLKVARSKLIDETGTNTDIEINRELFQKLQGMRLDKRPAEPGILVSMVREVQGVREFFGTATVGVVADLPFVLVFLLLIYTIAGPVVWIIITGAILMVLPNLLFQKKMMRLSKEMLGGTSAASRLLTEVSYGLENIKSSRSEPWLLRSWEEITQLNAIKSSEQRNLSAQLTFWSASIQQVTYIGGVIGGVYLLFMGEFTTGSIIAVSILSSRTLAPITQLANILSRWQNMKVSLSTLEKVIQAPQDHDPDRHYIRKARFAGQLTLNKVKYKYGQNNRASLYVETLEIKPGQRLALLGQNGSGKSTLLRLLSGLCEPTEGSYSVDAMDIHQIDPSDVRRNVGYLPQEVQLLRGHLRDNLRISTHEFTDEALMEALDFAGLGEFVRAHPEGLDLKVQDGGGGLSTGQKVAVELAKLYLQDPAVVLMDEPTAALDQQAESEFINRFGRWLGDRTCVMATHRTAFLSQMHQIALLKDGALVAIGPRDAMLEKLRGPS